MRAELRTLDSLDAQEGLAPFQPSDPERFGTAVGPLSVTFGKRAAATCAGSGGAD